jgi:hypothetical protein
VAHPLGRALLRVKGAGPLGQLPELATQLLKFPDPRVQIGGVALQQVGDMRAGCLPVVAEAGGRGQPMTTTGRLGRRPVIEVLYVQDCPHYPETLALVERVRAELGIDTGLRTRLIVDQAAAERARFPGSPTVRVVGRDVEPGSEPATECLVGCRLYRLEHSFAGQPEERWIRETVLQAVDSS